MAAVACSSVETTPDPEQHAVTRPVACALYSSCHPGYSFGETCQDLELDKLERPGFASAYACIEQAKSCADLDACWAFLKATPAQAAVCDQGWVLAGCAGDVLVYCSETDDDGAPYIHDCAAAGLTCSQGELIGTEIFAVCAQGTCDSEGPRYSCDGEELVSCEPWGAESKAACMPGTACGVTSGGGAGCVGKGEPCEDLAYVQHCEGTKQVSCFEGKTMITDCAELTDGLTCSSDEHGIFCDGAGGECDGETPETCEEGVVGFCIWGKWTTLDCKAYGMSGCETHKSSKHTHARCTLD